MSSFLKCAEVSSVVTHFIGENFIGENLPKVKGRSRVSLAMSSSTVAVLRLLAILYCRLPALEEFIPI